MKDYRQAYWSEPLLHELSRKGKRGYIPPKLEEEIKEAVEPLEKVIPKNLLRSPRRPKS